jgi:hypothetical protein
MIATKIVYVEYFMKYFVNQRSSVFFSISIVICIKYWRIIVDMFLHINSFKNYNLFWIIKSWNFEYLICDWLNDIISNDNDFKELKIFVLILKFLF